MNIYSKTSVQKSNFFYEMLFLLFELLRKFLGKCLLINRANIIGPDLSTRLGDLLINSSILLV